MRKRIVFLLCFVLLLSLGGCNGSKEQEKTSAEETSSVTGESEKKSADEEEDISGCWKSASGYILDLMPEESLYTYQTISGRVGQGTLTKEKKTTIINFGGGQYETKLNDDGMLILRRKDESKDRDEESLDGYYFERNDEAVVSQWKIQDLAGSFTNEAGDQITIYAVKMRCEAQTATGTKNEGSISDDKNGKGLYLSLTQKGYLIPGEDYDSFTLEFSDTDSKTMGDCYKGTFYRDGSEAETSESVVMDEDEEDEEVEESLKEMTQKLTETTLLSDMEEAESTDEDTGEYYYKYVTKDKVTTVYNVGTLIDAGEKDDTDEDIILKAAEDLAAGEGYTADQSYIEEKGTYSDALGHPVCIVRYRTGGDEEIYRWIVYGTRTEDAVYVYGFKSLTTFYYKVANSYVKVFDGLILQ